MIIINKKHITFTNVKQFSPNAVANFINMRDLETKWGYVIAVSGNTDLFLKELELIQAENKGSRYLAIPRDLVLSLNRVTFVYIDFWGGCWFYRINAQGISVNKINKNNRPTIIAPAARGFLEAVADFFEYDKEKTPFENTVALVKTIEKNTPVEVNSVALADWVDFVDKEKQTSAHFFPALRIS